MTKTATATPDPLSHAEAQAVLIQSIQHCEGKPFHEYYRKLYDVAMEKTDGSLGCWPWAQRYVSVLLGRTLTVEDTAYALIDELGYRIR